MLTGTQYTFFDRNRIVAKEDLNDYFLEFYREVFRVLHAKVLFPQPGLFSGVTLSASGNDKFNVVAPSPTGMADGYIIDKEEDPDYCGNVQFENALGIDYHVGLHSTQFPVGVEVSPLDGKPRAKYLKNIIGSNWDNPDAVVDNLDGTLTFTVDGATESGVSNAGRYVFVICMPNAPTTWDLPPGATDEDKAWQVCQVSWDGSNNKITTDNTPPKDGYFGQSTPSTSAADYYVVLLGPAVKRNTDLSLDDNYIYLGTVEGGGAGNPMAGFDGSGQHVYSSGMLSLLDHITRVENVPPNRLKVDVKAHEDEENTNTSQMRVTGWDGVGGQITVFDVDEMGNVEIQGDLTVQGETVQEDLVTVNASEIITDNLTLGDVDTDFHLIKGSWSHVNQGETSTWFIVDGTQSGHVGIGGVADATYALKVTGGAVIDQVGSDLDPATPEALSLGDTTNKWEYLWVNEIHIKRTDDPALDFWDEGEAVDEKRWGFFCTGGSFYAFTLTDAGLPTGTWLQVDRSGTTVGTVELGGTNIFLNPGNLIQVSVDLEPNAPDSLNCGDLSNYWQQVCSCDFLARDGATTDPSLTLYHGDAGANLKYWRMYGLSTGQLVITALNDSLVPSATTGIVCTRSAGDVAGFKVTCPTVEFECSANIFLDGHVEATEDIDLEGDLLPNTPGTPGSIGAEDSEFLLVHSEQLHLKRDDDTRGPQAIFENESSSISALNHRFEIQAPYDAGPPTRAKLKICLTGDDGGNEASYMEFLRSGLTPVQIRAIDFYPLTTTENIGGPNAGELWQQGHFSDRVQAKYLDLTGDQGSGGGGAIVRLSNTVTGINDNNDAAIRVTSAGVKNAGWLKFYIATTVYYIPYFLGTDI